MSEVATSRYSAFITAPLSGLWCLGAQGSDNFGKCFGSIWPEPCTGARVRVTSGTGTGAFALHWTGRAGAPSALRLGWLHQPSAFPRAPCKVGAASVDERPRYPVASRDQPPR